MPRSGTYAWIVLLAAGGAAMTSSAQVWKDKPINRWTPAEARLVITDSPWAQSVTPEPNETAKPGRTRGMGPDGIGLGGFNLGLPGGGRRGGMNGAGRRPDDTASQDSGPLPTLTLRWISALPISSAQMIARELNAPVADEDHYAIAVYGLSSRSVRGDPNNVGTELKARAALKREGKKDIAPSSVEVVPRDEGPVIVYFFPRSSEIARKDKQVEFQAEIGRLKFSKSFVLDEMVYQGKLEL